MISFWWKSVIPVQLSLDISYRTRGILYSIFCVFLTINCDDNFCCFKRVAYTQCKPIINQDMLLLYTSILSEQKTFPNTLERTLSFKDVQFVAFHFVYRWFHILCICGPFLKAFENGRGFADIVTDININMHGTPI